MLIFQCTFQNIVKHNGIYRLSETIKNLFYKQRGKGVNSINFVLFGLIINTAICILQNYD